LRYVAYSIAAYFIIPIGKAIFDSRNGEAGGGTDWKKEKEFKGFRAK
jgi:hypothetical protein